jgi:hypothetical protein
MESALTLILFLLFAPFFFLGIAAIFAVILKNKGKP